MVALLLALHWIGITLASPATRHDFLDRMRKEVLTVVLRLGLDRNHVPVEKPLRIVRVTPGHPRDAARQPIRTNHVIGDGDRVPAFVSHDGSIV